MSDSADGGGQAGPAVDEGGDAGTSPGTDGSGADTGDGGDGGPAQVSSPNYHHENHTAAQTCGWTANALRGEGKCYKNI